MSYIECKDVTLAYKNKILSSDINFSVNKGDYLCIVGENGVGKTTLIKSILHILPIKKGRIIFSDGLEKSDIGYLPQVKNFQIDFPATIHEIVLSGCSISSRFLPFYTKKEKLLAEHNMRKMGIYELKDKKFKNLSGGQQQRVLLARALSASHKMLIVDEPVAALDPVITLQFYRDIKRLNEEGITIIMISHDIENVSKYASHILHLGKKQLFFGVSEEYNRSNFFKKEGIND